MAVEKRIPPPFLTRVCDHTTVEKGWHGLAEGLSVEALAVKHGHPLRVSPWHPVEADYREFLDVRCRELEA